MTDIVTLFDIFISTDKECKLLKDIFNFFANVNKFEVKIVRYRNKSLLNFYLKADCRLSDVRHSFARRCFFGDDVIVQRRVGSVSRPAAQRNDVTAFEAMMMSTSGSVVVAVGGRGGGCCHDVRRRFDDVTARTPFRRRRLRRRRCRRQIQMEDRKLRSLRRRRRFHSDRHRRRLRR